MPVGLPGYHIVEARHMFRKTMLTLPLGLLTLAACSDFGLDPTEKAEANARLLRATSVVQLAEPFSAIPDTVALTYNGAALSSYANSRTSVRVVSSDTTVLVPTADHFGLIARGSGKASITVRIGNLLRATQVFSVPVFASTRPPASPEPAPPPPSGQLLRSDFATLPTDSVRFSAPVRTGRLLRVASGQSVQAAIDSAVYGDEIVLARGAVFTENVKLRRKTGSGWIIISGEGLTVPEGVRATPSSLTGVARLQTGVNAVPAIEAEAGASGYWMRGFEVTAAANVTTMYNLVMLDALVRDAAQLPSRLVVDRMWIHGRDDLGLFRCVMLGANRSQVVESWVDKCHIPGFDSQAVLIVNGKGPYLVRNNHLEGAGENLMVGGMNPTIDGVIPEDIQIIGNHLVKPLSWMSKTWAVKNLLEIKFGRRIDIRENVLENNWVNGQNGMGVLIRASDQDKGVTFPRTNDVTFRHNLLSNSGGGIFLIADGPVYLNRVAVLGNVFRRIGVPELTQGVVPRLVHMTGPISQIDLSYNTLAFVPTATPTGSAVTLSGTGASDIRINNNIFDGGAYGVIADGTAPGEGALTAYRGTRGTFTNNAITAPSGARYPDGTTVLPPQQSAFGFSDFAGSIFTLVNSSPIALSHSFANEVFLRTQQVFNRVTR